MLPGLRDPCGHPFGKRLPGEAAAEGAAGRRCWSIQPRIAGSSRSRSSSTCGGAGLQSGLRLGGGTIHRAWIRSDSPTGRCEPGIAFASWSDPTRSGPGDGVRLRTTVHDLAVGVHDLSASGCRIVVPATPPPWRHRRRRPGAWSAGPRRRSSWARGAPDPRFGLAREPSGRPRHVAAPASCHPARSAGATTVIGLRMFISDLRAPRRWNLRRCRQGRSRLRRGRPAA